MVVNAVEKQTSHWKFEENRTYMVVPAPWCVHSSLSPLASAKTALAASQVWPCSVVERVEAVGYKPVDGGHHALIDLSFSLNKEIHMRGRQQWEAREVSPAFDSVKRNNRMSSEDARWLPSQTDQKKVDRSIPTFCGGQWRTCGIISLFCSHINFVVISDKLVFMYFSMSWPENWTEHDSNVIPFALLIIKLQIFYICNLVNLVSLIFSLSILD